MKRVLQSHLELDAIDALHLFCQRAEDVPWSLLERHDVAHKTLVKLEHDLITFARMLQYAQQYLVGKFVVLSNADISFDISLAMLHQISDRVSLKHTLISLSRDDQCDPNNYIGSHDAWIIVPPLRNFEEVINHTDFYCGGKWGWGCENRFMWEMQHRAGLESVNPCLSIRASHVHVTQTA